MTPAQIRELSLADVERLFKHWARFPPVRVLVASAVGFEPAPEESEQKYITREDIERLVKITGPQIKIPGAM